MGAGVFQRQEGTEHAGEEVWDVNFENIGDPRPESHSTDRSTSLKPHAKPATPESSHVILVICRGPRPGLGWSKAAGQSIKCMP